MPQIIRSIAVAAARSDSVAAGWGDGPAASPAAAGALIVLMIAPGSAVMSSILTSAGIRTPTSRLRPAYRRSDTLGLTLHRRAESWPAGEQEVHGGVPNPWPG